MRRRRECEACGERFSTLETIELKLPAVIKSDRRRDTFDARKLRQSFDRALHKRPVSEEHTEAAVRAVIHQLRMTTERELPRSRERGSVMAERAHPDNGPTCRPAPCPPRSRQAPALRKHPAPRHATRPPHAPPPLSAPDA